MMYYIYNTIIDDVVYYTNSDDVVHITSIDDVLYTTIIDDVEHITRHVGLNKKNTEKKNCSFIYFFNTKPIAPK